MVFSWSTRYYKTDKSLKHQPRKVQNESTVYWTYTDRWQAPQLPPLQTQCQQQNLGNTQRGKKQYVEKTNKLITYVGQGTLGPRF